MSKSIQNRKENKVAIKQSAQRKQQRENKRSFTM